jgi:hypothetical protein
MSLLAVFDCIPVIDRPQLSTWSLDLEARQAPVGHIGPATTGGGEVGGRRAVAAGEAMIPFPSF